MLTTGIEPMTFALPMRCATDCATSAYFQIIPREYITMTTPCQSVICPIYSAYLFRLNRCNARRSGGISRAKPTAFTIATINLGIMALNTNSEATLPIIPP